MLTKIPFYHGVIRKTTVAFGALFNNLYVVNNTAATGKARKIIKVPLSYAPKDKYVIRLQQDPTNSKLKEVTLPRMSFEMVGYSYDGSRHLNKINSVTSESGQQFQYVPVPYVLTFSLSTYTKTVEDNLQIVEQIVPYFAPEMVVSVKMIPDMGIIQDIPFTLQSIDTSDSYDGQFDDNRMIITDYIFSAKINLYGPINGLKDYPNEGHFGPSDQTGNAIKKVFVDVNGNTAKYKAQVDPESAGPNDSYQILENWNEDSFE